MPVVLLADVRSVGVQGDGRTYGHPVVLRPVTSEDAMTADWARLPYDVMERISTRITNEVAEINRVTIDITSKPPGHHRVGVSRTAADPRRHVALGGPWASAGQRSTGRSTRLMPWAICRLPLLMSEARPPGRCSRRWSWSTRTT